LNDNDGVERLDPNGLADPKQKRGSLADKKVGVGECWVAAPGASPDNRDGDGGQKNHWCSSAHDGVVLLQRC
jgi:hypothetical protein